MSERALERDLEWEAGSQPIVLQYVEWPTPPFIPGMRKLTIKRDDECRLEIKAEGVIANPDDLRSRFDARRDMPAGAFMDADEVVFDAYGATCALTAFLDPMPNFNMTGERTEFEQHGHVLRFSRTFKEKFGEGEEVSLEPVGAAEWRTEWFLNGPHSPIFMRFTKRRRTGSFSRERKSAAVSIKEPPRRGDGRDHVFVDAGAIRFALCQVPDEYAAKWWHATGMEFRSPIPDEDTREAVAEIVSFVVGRRLLRLGSTVYDASGWAIEQEMVNPITSGLRSHCSGPDLPPVPFSIPSLDIEAILATLVPAYLKVRSDIGLRNALWAYWAACEASAPINLALFRSAVEALKKGWFASTKTKSKGVYMPKEEYEALTADLIATVRLEIAGRDGATAIVSKLGRAHQMGSNEQVRTFFAEIGLPVGEREEHAMRAANIPAHGGITTGGELKDLVRHGRAYRALFERTFLRLLGYDGLYVDRTSLGFPERPLNEAPGSLR